LQVPAKVLLAGEYALLEPHGTGLALAVVPGFRIEAAWANRWEISLPDLALRAGGKTLAAIDNADMAVGYVVAALKEATRLLPDLKPLSISFASVPGRVPVGASASLVAGSLLAVARLTGRLHGRDPLIAAGVTAHGSTQGGGSGYDVATILHGGSVRISAPTKESPLAVERASLFPGLTIVAARAGEAAPTGPLIATVLQGVKKDLAMRRALGQHIDSSRALVEALTNGPDWATIIEACEDANGTLSILDSGSQGAILTAPVRAAIEAAGPAPVRVSGAGGGDLVVGFAPDSASGRMLSKRWRAAGLDTWLLEPAPIS